MFRAVASLGLVILLTAATPIPLSKPAQQLRPPVTEQQRIPAERTASEDDVAGQLRGAASSHSLQGKAERDQSFRRTEDDKGWWQKLWTDPIAFFTAVLAVFTIILSFATIRAANAAKEATRALPALERAYIYLEVRQFKSASDAACRGRSLPVVTFYLLNPGRTPAIVKSARSKIDVAAVPDRIPETAHERSTLPIEWVIAPNTPNRPDDEDYSRSLVATLRPFVRGQDMMGDDYRLSPEEARRIREDGEYLWIWAKIIYDDVFGWEHKTASLYRIDKTGTIEMHGGKDWNYRT